MTFMDYMQEFDKKVVEFKRELVRTELRKRTAKQIEMFNRMYDGIDEIKEEDMANAYSQIKTTEDKDRDSQT